MARHLRRGSWQARIPEVAPSDALTQLLCLRDGFRLSALTTVPALANNTWLAGSLSASAEQRNELAALVEHLWDIWTLTSATEPPDRDAEWRRVQLFKGGLDSEHVVGRWMAEQFDPLLHRVMDLQFTNPKAVPESLAGPAVSRAVDRGLEQVLVLPLSRDYWDWRRQARLLVVAEVTRNNTATYQTILATGCWPAGTGRADEH